MQTGRQRLAARGFGAEVRSATLAVACTLTTACPLPVAAQPVQIAAVQDLANLSLEELRDVVVSSVSRREQPLLEAATSIYVISGDAIRRLGITTLPEALRLAPNLLVGAIDNRQYAVSARGFNGNVANKLLVMVDGRTLYSPLFSGVFWDAQDFVPSNIDRIEVISGPAGATWGTNAVNGVINVVTLSAAQTQGPSVSTTLGNAEKTVVGRHGFTVADGLAVRAHVRAFERDASQLLGGGDQNDGFKGKAAGIRADWSKGDDAVMLNAGVYSSETEARPVVGAVDLSGANITGRWSRRLSEASNFDVQAYFDRTERTDRFLLQEEADIFDVEAKYRHTLGKHRWLAGLGYRRAEDRAEPGLLFAFRPETQEQSWYSAFAQDEVSLTDELTLTLGLRAERNPYTGWESLPSVRLGYALNRNAYLWAGLSRAVRSPARFDREIFAPPEPPFVIAGGPNFDAEVARVAELGYRVQLGAAASLSATAFIQDYDRLRSGELRGSQLVIENGIEGEIRGLEAWGHWGPSRQWRLEAGLLWLDENLRLKPGSTDPVGPSNLGNDPEFQWSLRSTHSFGERVDFTIAVRRVGSLPSPEIPGYTATDLTGNWRIRNSLSLSLGVRNAFDGRHAEYQGFSSVSEVPRSAFVGLTYQPR